jgi:hypothetical protein
MSSSIVETHLNLIPPDSLFKSYLPGKPSANCSVSFRMIGKRLQQISNSIAYHRFFQSRPSRCPCNTACTTIASSFSEKKIRPRMAG